MTIGSGRGNESRKQRNRHLFLDFFLLMEKDRGKIVRKSHDYAQASLPLPWPPAGGQMTPTRERSGRSERDQTDRSRMGAVTAQPALGEPPSAPFPQCSADGG